MNNLCLIALTILMAHLGLSSCKNEETITYEDAISNCKIPDGKFFNGKDTVFINPTSPKCVIGAQFPMFISTFMDGQPLNEAYFNNKINIVNFWFIGCHPCEAEMPGFNALVERYKDKPVNFLGISPNTPKDIQEFLVDHPFKVDHIAMGALITKDIFHMAWGYPMTFVSDHHGKILYAKNTGASDSLAIQHVQDELIPVIDGALKKM